MKFPAVGLLVLSLLTAGAAFADHRDDCPNITIKDGCCDGPTRWADRWESADARLAITTEDGAVTLLLGDREVAMQLSNRTLHKLDRKIHEKNADNDDEDNPLGQAIKSAILSAVRSMLDHSMDCRLRDVRSAEYRDGRLVLVDNDGDRIFDRVSVDGRQVLENFSPADARAFVAEFDRLKHRR